MQDHLSDVIGETCDKFMMRPQYAVPMYTRYAVHDRTGMTSLEQHVTFRATVRDLALGDQGVSGIYQMDYSIAGSDVCMRLQS